MELLALLADLLKGDRLNVIDVGASGGVNHRWQSFSNTLTFIGFEPDLTEFSKLRQDTSHRFFNYALAGEKGKRTFYLTKVQSNSSLLRPNYDFLRYLQWSLRGSEYDFDVVKETQVECITLDDFLWEMKIPMDFLKIDTQGSELEILQGGRKGLMDTCILSEIEVEFVQIYENQPLFSDVDQFMRECGFILHDLGNILWIKPRGMAGVGGPKGRIIAGDALYMKDFTSWKGNLDQIEDRKIIASLIGYLAYGYPESALSLLDFLSKNKRRINHCHRLRRLISELKMSSQRLIWLPYRSFFMNLANKIYRNLRKPEHYLWDLPIGNQSLYWDS